MNPRTKHTDTTERFFSYYYFYFTSARAPEEDEA